MKLTDQDGLKFRGDNMGMSFDTCLDEQLPKLVVFVLDVARLRKNLETAKRVREEAGCKVLLATKAFAMPAAPSDTG